MNREQLEGRWKQLKGSARSQWGKITDDEMDQINGNAEQLEGKVQERYGKSKEEAREEVNKWLDGQNS